MLNRHCDFFCLGIWPFLVGPLLLLLPLLFFQWHPIENQVARNSQTELAELYSWATAETYNRGRDVLLTGSAPSLESVNSALATAKTAQGVRSVKFVGEVIQPKVPIQPAKVSATMINGDIVLTGAVDSQQTINEVVKAAQAKLTSQGDGKVRNELKLAENTVSLPLITGAIAALTEIDKRGAFELYGNQLTLKGEVSGDIEKARLGQLAANGFSGDIINDLLVVEPPCQLAISALLKDSKINFASGQALIQASSQGLLEQISSAAKQCKEAEFEVSGHTDSTGDRVRNIELSQARANAVVKKLLELGLAEQRFSTRGAGDKEPIADNNSAAGRAQNRRIEFRVTN